MGAKMFQGKLFGIGKKDPKEILRSQQWKYHLHERIADAIFLKAKPSETQKEAQQRNNLDLPLLHLKGTRTK